MRELSLFTGAGGFSWCDENIGKVVQMKESGFSVSSISKAVGASESSVKHKLRRIQQDQNLDRYKHTDEKVAQAVRFLSGDRNEILETNCGYGGMTELYSKYGNVHSYDVSKKRVDHVNAIGFESVQAIKADSEKEIIALLFAGCRYSVIDLDPYGFPSRYFPHVFGLIDDGVLFVTFPMMGVAQINKIMIAHYKAFWGITLADKESYIEKIVERMADYAFMHKREISVLSVDRIDRIYRIALSVKKKSCLEIVGLDVNRGSRVSSAQKDLFSSDLTDQELLA